MVFGGKCYWVDQRPAPYQTWEGSRQTCRDEGSDLLIINSLQEQEFLSSTIPPYLDQWHGYWFGLDQQEESWVWIDGRNDTHMFWIEGGLGASGRCVMMIPQRNATASWDPADCRMENRFICEAEALLSSNQTLMIPELNASRQTDW